MSEANSLPPTLSRRQFLEVTFGAPVVALLAGCSTPSTEVIQRSSETQRQINDEEWRMLVARGVIDRTNPLEYAFLEDENLSQGAREYLVNYLSGAAFAREGSALLKTGWQRVATPQFLQEIGAYVGEDVTQAFTCSRCNGGLSAYLPESDMYLKMEPVGTNYAAYLRESLPQWQQAWRVAGMPDEMIQQIQLIENLTYRGREYLVLATPNADVPLEKYARMLRVSGISQEQYQLQITSMLQDFYREVLLPASQAGVIFPDANWNNMTVYTDASGKTRLVPIDFDGRRYLIESSLIPQWEYQRLALAAQKRGIQLPTFKEYVVAHGIDVPVAEWGSFELPVRMGEEKIYLQISNDSLSSLSQEAIDEVLAAIDDQVRQSIREVPYGSEIPISVETSTGETVVINLRKTTAFGDEILSRGGQMGKLLKGAGEGLRIGADLLFAYWVASEFTEAIAPPYRVVFESSVATPTLAAGLGETTLYQSLDNIYEAVMFGKNLQAARQINNLTGNYAPPAALRDLDPNEAPDPITGINNYDFRYLMEEYGLTYQEISDAILNKVKGSLYPAVALSEFQSPVPLFMDNPQYNLGLYFSAVEDGEGNKMIVMWAAETSTANEGRLKLAPVAYFSKTSESVAWVENRLEGQSRAGFSNGGGMQFFCPEYQVVDGRLKFNCPLED